MKRTTKREPEPEGGARSRGRFSRPSRLDRRHLAVVQAEARRLARALEPFGVLSKDQLKLRAGAASWHEGSFDNALRTAVESGEIEQLPLDFYRKGEPQDETPSGGSGPGAA